MKHGFSTGCFHKNSNNLEQIAQWYTEVAPDALELCLISMEVFNAAKITPRLKELVRGFAHRSIHAPCAGIVYQQDEQSRRVLDMLVKWNDELGLDGIVFHPDTIYDFGLIESYGFRACIENMDRGKKCYKTPEELYQLSRNYDFDFVIDIEHTYEVCAGASFVQEFLDAVGSRVRYCHVSGQTAVAPHSPIHLADNRSEILSYISLLPDVPLINEGTYAAVGVDVVLSQMQQELECIRLGS